MTPEETRQAAQVMLAHADGKRIEWRRREDADDWWSDTEVPRWDWCKLEYRVATERWSGKIWVHESGIVRDTRYFPDGPVIEGWRLIEAKEVEP